MTVGTLHHWHSGTALNFGGAANTRFSTMFSTNYEFWMIVMTMRMTFRGSVCGLAGLSLLTMGLVSCGEIAASKRRTSKLKRGTLWSVGNQNGLT